MRRKRARAAEKPPAEPYRVRLPGFVIEGDVGLGDAMKRATYAIGITPCGGCGRRAEALNRWIVFSRSGQRGH